MIELRGEWTNAAGRWKYSEIRTATTQEHHLQKGSGQYATSIGFIDVVFDFEGVVEGTKTAEWSEAKDNYGNYRDVWTPCEPVATTEILRWKMLVEVKIAPVGIGDVLRQLNLYATSLHGTSPPPNWMPYESRATSSLSSARLSTTGNNRLPRKEIRKKSDLRINEINELNEVSVGRISRQEVCANVTRLISLISLISIILIGFLNMVSAPLTNCSSRLEAGEAVAYPEWEMWASKSLSLQWLPRCTASCGIDVSWSDPCLLSVTAHPERDLVIPQKSNANRLPEWHWRVSIEFGAWAHRAIHRAQSLGAPLEESLKERYRIILAYLNELDPENGKRVVERAAAGPVVLPGNEMIAVLVNHARFGLCPKWEGWEALAAIDDEQEKQRENERIRSRERRRAAVVKPVASTSSRTASVVGMF